MFIAQPLRTHIIYKFAIGTALRVLKSTNIPLLTSPPKIGCWLVPLEGEKKNTVRCYKSRSPSQKNKIAQQLYACV